jgi:CRP/FNR family transcriptional regulator, cyclic AMP receptor protein
MHAISDNAVSQQSLAAPSIASYLAGEIVLNAASTIGRLPMFKGGVVPIVKEGVEIARKTEAVAVFCRLSAWLDQPHTADFRALEESKSHVVNTAASLVEDPVTLPYGAMVMEGPEDSIDRTQMEPKQQVQVGELSSITHKTINKIEESLGASGGNLVYGGYPYDPFVLDTVKQ